MISNGCISRKRSLVDNYETQTQSGKGSPVRKVLNVLSRQEKRREGVLRTGPEREE